MKFSKKIFTWSRLALIILFTIAFMIPIFYIIQLSFRQGPELSTFFPKRLSDFTLQNYYQVLRVSPFGKYLINSIWVSVSTVGWAMLLGVPAAYALARTRVKAISSIMFAILLVRMVPPMTLAFPFFLIYVRLGLIDTLIGITLVYLTFAIPMVIWMMKPFFEAVPLSIEEAAAIDGCSQFEVFRYIVLPLVSQGIIATAILTWTLSWNEFLFALILTRQNIKTAPVAITMFLRFEDVKWGSIAAAATLIATPVLIFSILVRKYLIRGLTEGAEKG